MGNNSSFIFTCYVKTVPVYDLVWVVLHSSVKEFFKMIYWQEKNNDVQESFQLTLKFHSFSHFSAEFRPTYNLGYLIWTQGLRSVCCNITKQKQIVFKRF